MQIFKSLRLSASRGYCSPKISRGLSLALTKLQVKNTPQILTLSENTLQKYVETLFDKPLKWNNFEIIDENSGIILDPRQPVSSYLLIDGFKIVKIRRIGSSTESDGDENDKGTEMKLVLPPKNSLPVVGPSNSIQHQELMDMIEKSMAKISFHDQLSAIEKKVEEIDRKLAPMDKTYQNVLISARSTSDNYLLSFLSLWTVCTMSIARLTWWEYSWDIMEPVAWAAQAGGMLFWGWYYFVTKSENAMEDLNHRVHTKKCISKLKKEGFDIEAYNELVWQRRNLEKDYDKICRRNAI